jgi:hypothetical protein
MENLVFVIPTTFKINSNEYESGAEMKRVNEHSELQHVPSLFVHPPMYVIIKY